MSDQKPTGGSAFPSLDVYEGYDRERDDYAVRSDVETGMTLRDYFAATAVASIGEDVHGVLFHARDGFPDRAIECAEEIAQASYLMADAMLKARQS